MGSVVGTEVRRSETLELLQRIMNRTAAGVVEVVLASGERVVVREGPSSGLVREVVAALRASC